MATRAKSKDAQAASAKPTANGAAKPRKVKLAEGERLLRPAKGGRLRHFVAPGEKTTLCGLDTTAWLDVLDESSTSQVTCRYCAARLGKGQRISDQLKHEQEKQTA